MQLSPPFFGAWHSGLHTPQLVLLPLAPERALDLDMSTPMRWVHGVPCSRSYEPEALPECQSSQDAMLGGMVIKLVRWGFVVRKQSSCCSRGLLQQLPVPAVAEEALLCTGSFPQAYSSQFRQQV